MTGEVIHEESSLHGGDGNRREEEKWERSCGETGTGPPDDPNLSFCH